MPPFNQNISSCLKTNLTEKRHYEQEYPYHRNSQQKISWQPD